MTENNTNDRRPRSLELFAGGGGLALGLHRAGFDHVALVERDDHAATTLKTNAAAWAERGGAALVPWSTGIVHHADVDDVLTGHALADVGDVDLLAGGPPCQPFSLAGQHRAYGDDRDGWPAALRYMREYLPPMVIWENVLGMTRQRVMPYFDYLLQAMRWPTTVPRPGDEWWHHAVRLDQRVRGPLNTRYRVGWQLVDAADFGVPQRRRRLIVVAIRADLLDDDDIPDLEPTHSRTQLHYAQWVSQAYWAEHGIDPPPDTPEEWHEARLLKLKKVAEKERDETELVRWLTVRDALQGLPQPVDGEEHPTILNHVGIPNARAYPGHTGSPIDKPAKTVKAGVHGVCGGEAMTRYPDDTLRYWTVREAARIQTFPDEYAFPVPRSRAMAQIGNAVPVRLAEAVGHHLRGLAGI